MSKGSSKAALKPTVYVKNLYAKARSRAAYYLSKRPHRTFRLTSGRRMLGGKKMPSLLSHIKSTLAFIWREKRVLFVLGLILAVFNFLIVGGVPQGDFVALKEEAQNFILGDWGQAGVVGTMFLSTVAGAAANAATEVQQFMGSLLVLIFWLAFIWAARMRMANKKIKARDAIYSAGAPIIPSIIVLAVIAVQSLPALLGIFAFSVTQSEGFMEGGVESMMMAAAMALLCLLSAYWVSASVVGMIMVTLPQTYPFQALAGASQLVVGQRWRLVTHALTAIVVVLVFWAVVLIPSLVLDGWLRFDWLPIVPIIAQFLTAFSVMFTSLYMYRLYRSLL